MGLTFNFDELENKLTEFSQIEQTGILDKALQSGGNVVLNEQKNTVPTDTGKLKASLGTWDKAKGGKSGDRTLYIGIKEGNEDRVLTYGYYQEHGTSKMAGQKWLTNSFYNSKNKAQQEIINSLVGVFK